MSNTGSNTGSGATSSTGSSPNSRGRFNSGSFGSRSNYNRLTSTFGPGGAGYGSAGATAATGAAVLPPEGYRQEPDGSWLRWTGAGWAPSPEGPAATRPQVSDVRPFVASEALNKVLLLSAIAVVFGIGAAVVKLPVGVALVTMVAALVVALVAIFRPRLAHVLAPAFAALEGITLGVVSGVIVGGDGQIVPIAIIGTTAVFFGVLAAYRTGLVRVGNNFIRATIISGFGLLAVMIAVMLGLRIPGTSQNLTYIIVFGVLYLVVAVMDLFIDFNYLYQAERAGVSAEGEWFAALMIMFAVVMIYLALLRILGGRR